MKRMLIIMPAVILLAGYILTACSNGSNEPSKKEESCRTLNADSLIGLWNNAWNTKNLESLKDMIAGDAMVIDHDWYVKGRDSILSKWITRNLPKISNLSTTVLKVNSCCCCIGMTGFYSLEYTDDKGGKQNEKGNFTFIWTKQDDKSYRLETIHLTEFYDMQKK